MNLLYARDLGPLLIIINIFGHLMYFHYDISPLKSISTKFKYLEFIITEKCVKQ